MSSSNNFLLCDTGQFFCRCSWDWKSTPLSPETVNRIPFGSLARLGPAFPIRTRKEQATPTRAQLWFTAEGPTWQQQLALHSDRWGHVTFGIPLELLCTQHFCQHSIWWANFTEGQQTCTYPPISKANPVHQNGSWLKANAYKIKLRPLASAPRWNTI